MLSAVNINLQQREDALTRSLSLLEHEREIVRRQLGLVAELLTLEQQRVAAQAGEALETEAGVEGEHTSVATSTPAPRPAPDAQVEDEAKPPTTQEAQAEPMLESEAEPDPEAHVVDGSEAVTQIWAAAEPTGMAETQPDGESEPTEAHNSDLLWRIEQLRRLRANLAVASPAVPDDLGNAR